MFVKVLSQTVCKCKVLNEGNKTCLSLKDAHLSSEMLFQLSRIQAPQLQLWNVFKSNIAQKVAAIKQQELTVTCY